MRIVALGLAGAVGLVAACATGGGDPSFGETDDATGGATAAPGSGPTTTDGSSSGDTSSGDTSSGDTSSSNTSSSGDSSSGAGGSGGESSSSQMQTSGSGGMPPGTGGMTASSTGSSMNNCAHDVCTLGPALNFGCGDPCVDQVCSSDPFCCDQMSGLWDEYCVDGAVQICAAPCAPIVQYGDLVITEIMNNPAAVNDTDGEWFEVYNDAPYSIDLNGLQIAHQANSMTAVETITQSVVLAPGGYAVLARNANPTTNGNVTVDYQYSSMVSLNNTTDYLALLDATSSVIDELTYDENSGLDPSGASRSLDPFYQSAFDNDTDTNFCEATSTMVGGVDLGTPGLPNDNCIP